MDNWGFSRMQIFNRSYEILNHGLDMFLRKSPNNFKLIEKTFLRQLKHQVKILVIFDAVVHLDNILMFKLGGNFDLFIELRQHISFL